MEEFLEGKGMIARYFQKSSSCTARTWPHLRSSEKWPVGKVLCS